ncbi:ABC transporter permease [Clostridium estertheticum]|uniref:ABC transporter permease n=1 Tax=Clostridium estertheticum TaxID=238834 RepID=UPI001C0E7464|nr:ABC transporter permease [Clostridium estertheticum]MBU3215615.1 ABC transporter permease [Clostridium estertheticum]WAG56767.1 ABC transporter permease [Clostridium estertheticum]
MKRLITSEFQRIWGNRKTQLLLVFYVVVIISSCVFRLMSPYGAYDGVKYNVDLNRLNFSPFVFYEIRFELLYIILPILFMNSINYEQSIGAFRMYVIRPYKKQEFIISKWIALALTTFIFIFTAFIISTVFGYLFMPKASYVTFYNIQQDFSMAQAFSYTIKFFSIQFVISLCILALASVIGIIINNSVISILSVIAISVGLGFFTKAFEFLNYTTKYGFYVLANTAPISFYMTLIAILVVGLFVSMFLWQKKDHLY